MSEKKATTREEMMAVEIIIGKIMRIGVFLAATVMIIGFAMLMIKGTSGYPGNSPVSFPECPHSSRMLG